MGDRSDKKAQTKPYVSIGNKEIVEDIRRYLKQKSNGEIAHNIVMTAIEDWHVLRQLQQYLRWDYHLGDHTFVGHMNHAQITDILPGQFHRTIRLPIRFTQNDIRKLEVLYTCLGCPWAHMVGALLKLGLESDVVIQKVASGFVPRSAYSFRQGVFRR